MWASDWSSVVLVYNTLSTMCGVGKVNVVCCDSFPPFPSHYVPCRPHLTAMFVKDYWENNSHIRRELRAILSSHSLAVDHQRKVVKRTLGGDVVGCRGQAFTICEDFGLICGVYVVPDTALSWVKKAMDKSSTGISHREWRCPRPCTSAFPFCKHLS